jgi:hypothetical protein
MGYTGLITEGMLKCMRADQRKPMGKAGRTIEEIDEANAVEFERDLQRDIANYLRQRNITAISSRMDKRTRNTKGCPDFLFAINGRPIAIEAKRPGGKLRPDQEAMRDGLLNDGWTHIVCYRLSQVMDLFPPWA